MRKKPECDEDKFGFLVKTLSTQYKRIVMGFYKDHESECKKTKKCTTTFDKAIEKLKESVARLEGIERDGSVITTGETKAELKVLKIKDFKLYGRLDKLVRHLEKIEVLLFRLPDELNRNKN